MEAIYKNFFRDKNNSDPILKALEKVPIFENLSDKELKNIASSHMKENINQLSMFLKNMLQPKACILYLKVI